MLVIYIKNHCILHTKSIDKSIDKTLYFILKFSSIYTKNLPNMQAKLNLKCINFRCILQSVKTVGLEALSIPISLFDTSLLLKLLCSSSTSICVLTSSSTFYAAAFKALKRAVAASNVIVDTSAVRSDRKRFG